MRMLTMMMIPPIEGTPFFSVPKGSIDASRAVSVMRLRFMYLMKRSPNHAEMSRERMRVSNERNEMYDQICAPGISYCSRNLKR